MINVKITDDANIKVVVGKHYETRTPNHIQMSKAIVFDLDETIGHFTHLLYVSQAMEVLINRELKQEEFNELLDLYPEFLRPGILIILDFLYLKTHQNVPNQVKLYLYTNNKFGKSWVQKIVKYIESKINIVNGLPLFSEIVYVFKHKNKIIDLRRKSNEKTNAEMIECMTIIEPTTEICFIDNTLHEKICSDKVYYIKPRAYFHNLSKTAIIQRLLEYIPVSVAPFNRDKLHNLLYTYCKENHYTQSMPGIDSEITRKIMYHIRTFLYFTKHYSMDIVIPPNSKKSLKNRKKQNKLGITKKRKQ